MPTSSRAPQAICSSNCTITSTWPPLEKACAAFHHASGPGARPTHPVPQLVRAFLVKYLFNWSLREIEWQVRFNLVVKWFVGYPLFAAGPDHTTLERFDLWVCFHQRLWLLTKCYAD